MVSMLGRDGVENQRGSLWVFRNWRTLEDRGTLQSIYFCQNRLRFRAVLLVLNNKEVIEEHSNWKLGESWKKVQRGAWIGLVQPLSWI